RDPAVFLLDEPLSNLDAKLRTSMRAEIIKLHKQLGTTFVYVTHDQIEAMTMGDRIVVMKDGYIQQVDTPQNLYESPCNQFVAGFIGTPQMNFMDAQVAQDEFGYYLMLQEIGLRINKPVELLAPYVGRHVAMGIRPDNISVCADGMIQAKVDVAEALGGETYLNLDCFGEKIIVKMSGLVHFEIDDIVLLNFDVTRVHLFDRETGKTICN
ncbi:MAG: ABC transporter ATP-binding protein, partial [Clostridiales bacterium]